MIRTSEDKLRTFIRTKYARMLAESNRLNEKEIQELGRLLKRRMPTPEDVAGELDNTEWMSKNPNAFDEPDPGQTQPSMKTLDIIPGERRPLAKRHGLAESELRSVISTFFQDRLK